MQHNTQRDSPNTSAPIKIVLVFVVAHLFLLSLLSIFSLTRLSLGHDPAYEGTAQAGRMPSWFYGENLNRWDTGWYALIVNEGYTKERTAFFPLYPVLVRWLTATGMGFVFAASIVSLTATMIGLWFYYRLAHILLGSSSQARNALWLLLFFPTSFFLFAPYTEGLFFCLLMILLYGLQNKKMFSVTMAGYALALTRVVGVFSLILIVGQWIRERKEDGALKRLLIRSAWVVSGVATYMVYLALRFGDPLAFAHAQQQWDRNATISPSNIVHRFIQYGKEFQQVYSSENLAPIVTRLTDIGFFLLLAGVTVLVLRSWRKDYALWMASMVMLPLLSGTFISMPRYVAIVPFIPLFLARAVNGRESFQWLLTIFIVGWAMAVTMHAAGYWVA